jgi:hypothetical protein
MAIEDYVSAREAPLTGHAPSRVRTMLQTLGNQLQARRDVGTPIMFLGGKTGTELQLLAEVEEALREWQRLEALLIQVEQQRQHIATRISSFVAFYSIVRAQIRFVEGKKRRPLTSAQKVVAAAKLRQTRKLRRTMGKRQKKALKA